jgi:glycosyltransferase involved in cell wall biosynthesis
LRQQRIDLLHTHLFHADLVGRPAAALAGVPHLVHTVHTAEGRFRPWQFAYARFLADSCDRVVSVSPSARDFHARRSGLPLRRYEVIPNGLDAQAFARDEASRRRLRCQWGLGEDQVLLAFLGRLDREKGLDVLLSAMSHLAARGRPVEAIIAGEGPARQMIENFIAHGEGGRCCRYLGFVPDVRAVLSAADIFVMPSRWEGFGLAAAEAMAASLPVIASDIPPLRGLLDGGTAGVLVEPEGSVALGEAILRLAEDAPLRAALGSAGRRRVVEAYPIEQNIAAHERLYSQVTRESP